jgi:DNA-binding MarR family transcriptional regulator
MADLLDDLDDNLVRIRLAVRRPRYRDRMIAGVPELRGLSDLRMLAAIGRHSAFASKLSIRELAEMLSVEHSTASRGVSFLVTSGLVAKVTSAGDQRRVGLALTPRGTEVLEETTNRRRGYLAEVAREWTDSESTALISALSRVADALDTVERNS